jgi:V8-like Glu-specific endopeptidase
VSLAANGVRVESSCARSFKLRAMVVVRAKLFLFVSLWGGLVASAAKAQTPSDTPVADCIVPDVALLQRFEAARAKIPQTNQSKPIYGCDDRKDIYDARATAAQKLAARSTAVLVQNADLHTTDGGEHFDLPSDGAGLCSPEQAAAAQASAPERFWDQPAPGFCSGFKVGANLIATAGHCIKNVADCKRSSFVFGFQMATSDAKPEKGIAKGNIYHCTDLVGGYYSRNGNEEGDWRVVRVDRVVDAPTLNIRTPPISPALSPNTAVTVIGYPIGLPVKIADDATVRSIQRKTFVANLDTYGGNSGSVVLNSEKLAMGEPMAEGILIAGAPDFQTTSNGCYISKRCPNDGCSGEAVTLISEIGGVLKKR